MASVRANSSSSWTCFSSWVEPKWGTTSWFRKLSTGIITWKLLETFPVLKGNFQSLLSSDYFSILPKIVTSKGRKQYAPNYFIKLTNYNPKQPLSRWAYLHVLIHLQLSGDLLIAYQILSVVNRLWRGRVCTKSVCELVQCATTQQQEMIRQYSQPFVWCWPRASYPSDESSRCRSSP